MKILQVIQRPQLRGAEVFACQIAEELVARGHECAIVSLFNGDIELPYHGRIMHLGLSGKRRFIDWHGWKKLAEIILKENPDIIQANAGDTLKYCVLSKLLFHWKTPLVARNASTISLYIKTPFKRIFNMLLYSQVRYVLSVSVNAKNDFVKMFPRMRKKIDVVPVGVPLKPLTGLQTFPAGGNPTLIHIGGFTFEKNHKGLIKIFAAVKKKLPGARLWLIGDGPLKPEVEAQVHRLKLADEVIFLGSRPDVMSLLQGADALLLPSIIEGLPAVILEAFVCRKKVIAYNVGGISEIVTPGKTGWLVEKGNEEAFAEAVVNCLSHNSDSQEITQNAYDLVVKEYTIPQVVMKLESKYRSLVD